MCRKFCAHSKLWAVLSLLTLSFYACQSDGQKQEKQESVTENPQIITDTVAVDTLVKATKVEQKDTLEKETELMQHAAKDTIKLKSKADSTSPRYIYLTFDDGPLIGSQAIDSIATAKQIKVNAFVVGKHAGMSKKLQKYFQRYMDNPYVDIYNHSFTHANNKFNVFYSHPQQAFEDFEKNENTLGLSHKIVRLPGRNIWFFNDRKRIDLESGASTADILYMNGYKIMGWDVEWKINGLTGKPVESVSQIYRRMCNRLNNGTTFSKNNVVLLMHDDMFQNKKGQKLLSDLIDSLKTHPNYKFEHMREYPKSS